MPLEETRTVPGRTPGDMITAFRQRHGLTVDQLAALLTIDAETLCRYEGVGGGPPWLTYALVGVEYQEFGVITGEQNAESSQKVAGEERPLRPAPSVGVGTEPPAAAA